MNFTHESSRNSVNWKRKQEGNAEPSISLEGSLKFRLQITKPIFSFNTLSVASSEYPELQDASPWNVIRSVIPLLSNIWLAYLSAHQHSRPAQSIFAHFTRCHSKQFANETSMKLNLLDGSWRPNEPTWKASKIKIIFTKLPNVIQFEWNLFSC